MALKNAGRTLIVSTPLGDESDPEKDDPLVLAHVSGAEGISMPYAFDLTLVGTKDAEVAADRIVGHRAHFGIRKNKIVNTQREEGHEERFGVIESFERLGTSNARRVFRARLVPAFRMTAFEQRYRVFEDKTLVEILTEVLSDFPLVDLRHNLVSEVKSKVITYCAQFNETTFAFVHRLLDRSGISYRFEHDADLRRERMVLSDTVHRPNPVDGPMRVMGDDRENFDAIAGFRRGFIATAQNLRVGDFNTLDPRRPPEGLAIIDRAYAMGEESIGIRAEAFPASGVDVAEPDAAAKLKMRKNEAIVVSASGRTRSTGFFAGRQVPISADETGSGAEGSGWVLKLVTIEAFDVVDDRSTPGKIWDFLKSALGLGSGREQDLVGGAAEALRDRLKEDINKGKEVGSWLANSPGATNPSGLPDFIADKLGRVGSGIIGGATLLYSSVKAIAEIIEKAFKDSTGFAAAFEAFPVSDPFKPDRWPTPVSTRPLAAGPHLALVVGPKGVDVSENDIFTDALGRVRIRFPWDPGPPGKDADTPAEDPLTHERNTCWVRVAEGWAGERYGMQFLPRIGQEVLVGFIDGDPERPIVAGRAYNAASGNSHLPFPNLDAGKKSLTKIGDLPGTANAATTRSGLRTRSVPAKGATDVGFHMIRLEDEKGKEQFLLRAEHRLDITSTGGRFDTTRGSQSILVGGGKPPPDSDTGGGQFITIGGEQDLHVKQNRYMKVDTEEARIVDGISWHKYGDMFIDAGRIGFNCDHMMISAANDIVLFVGSAEVKITPAGVFCAGSIIQDKPSASSTMSGTTIAEPVDAGQADPGEPPDFLALQPKGKGGGRKRQGWGGREAIKVTRGPGNMLKLGKGGIQVDASDPDFANKALSDLTEMRKDPAQKQTVDKAMDRKNPVTIARSDASQDPKPVVSTDEPADATAAGQPTGLTDAQGKPVKGSGKGTGSTVAYDPLRGGQQERTDAPGRATRQKELSDALGEAQTDDGGTTPANSYQQSPQAPPAPAPATGGSNAKPAKATP